MKINGFLREPLIPSEIAPQNIRYDFNDGCRILTPEGKEQYTVTLHDLDSGNLLETHEMTGGQQWQSFYRFYVRYGMEIRIGERLVFRHEMDLQGKETLLRFDSDALGDTIAWFSYAARFQRKHGCKLGCVMNPAVADLFKTTYPDIAFFTKEEAKNLAPYATYRLGVRYDGDGTRARFEHQQVPLDALAGYDLGMDDEIRQEPPIPSYGDGKDGYVKEPHICLAFRASMAQKEWQREGGWEEVVEYIQSRGYRAICIDKDKKHGLHGAEDFTGDRPLQERLQTLMNAKMLVGLPSGLAWMAWMMRTPIVMISGFTEPWAEMPCRRVQNKLACHGCWNDASCHFKCGLPDWCPRENDHECTKTITPKMVIAAINQELGDRR